MQTWAHSFIGDRDMPLRSKQFSGDPRLEACLVKDTAHVLLNDRGPHVRKIQQAVVILGGYGIPHKELDEMLYGPGTAKAVLAYKRENSIINYSYQSSADNVVGKMTIQALDDGMCRFEAQFAAEPRPTEPHPQSPDIDNRETPREQPIPILGAPPSLGVRFAIGDTGDGWEEPVASWPTNLRATLERSNRLRTSANDYLAPIIPWGEGRKTLKELSKLLDGAPDTAGKIREIYSRMKPFGIWGHIAAIHNVYSGPGSRGFKADAENHDTFLRDMKTLSQHQNIIEQKVMKARFCQDIGNVHGPRDTFREVVLFGPGLHICITQPAERANPKYPSDIHIDTFQQGNLVQCGHCIPLPDLATAAHVISVSPYLADEAKKEINETKERAKQYLRKVQAKVPGL